MLKTVLGVFHDRVNAEDAISELEDAGYNPKDISIIMRDSKDAASFAEATGTDVATGAATGATTGAVVGGLTGLLIGVGAITVPGIGALLIGGPLAAALGLTGAATTTVSGAATGALAGGIIGALTGLGVSRSDAEIYEKHITEGAILLAVPATHVEEFQVRNILEQYGAIDINTVTIPIRSDTVMESDYYEEPVSEPYYGPTMAAMKGGRSSRVRRSRMARSRRMVR